MIKKIIAVFFLIFIIFVVGYFLIKQKHTTNLERIETYKVVSQYTDPNCEAADPKYRLYSCVYAEISICSCNGKVIENSSVDYSCDGQEYNCHTSLQIVSSDNLTVPKPQY